MILSNEQKLCYDNYIKGNNSFITGPGGSGKTALIKLIYQDALNKNRNIQVCALTGCAAILLNCKAKTIHSWSGVGGNVDGDIEKIAKKALVKSNIISRWKCIDVLIIDEISMLSCKLFDILDFIGKKVKSNNLPFGGIQLLFSGDFYQLPPIGNDELTKAFCFESKNWYKTFNSNNTIELKTIFRQSDKTYLKILNQIRKGKISKSTFDTLNSYVGREYDSLEIKPTKLYPLKRKVDFINQHNLNLLKEDSKTFELNYNKNVKYSKYSHSEIDKEFDYLINNSPCEKTIDLKIGAQVMCIINMDLDSDTPICNGSCGIISGFDTGDFPIVKFYNGIEISVVPHMWKSENIPSVYIEQIPLILSWALTIHKSQGTTLESAEIDIGSDIFEEGQTYVALSRLKDINGLYLKSFDPHKIKSNPKVIKFYNKKNDISE